MEGNRQAERKRGRQADRQTDEPGEIEGDGHPAREMQRACFNHLLG